MSQAEDPDEPNREDETAAPREFGLTQKGCQAAVSEYCEIEAYSEGRASSIVSLRDMYAHLIKRGRCEKAELLQHFTPVDAHHIPENGRYTRADDWWRDVGLPQLGGLPGVEVDGANDPGAEEVIRFTGFPPEARELAMFDDEHVVPLTELRDVTDHATDVLEDLGVGLDRRERILSLHPAPAEGFSKELTTESLVARLDEDAADVRRAGGPEDYFSKYIRGPLAELPGVSVEQRTDPVDPAEFEIETYADVLDAREAVEEEEEVREVWRFEGMSR